MVAKGMASKVATPVSQSLNRTRHWSWDGRAVTPFHGGIPLTDRGFRYGQHVFESIAVRNGNPLLVREHLALLAASASSKGIPLSRSLTAALRGFFSALPALALPDGMLRLYITAGPGAPASAVSAPACFLAWERMDFPSLSQLAKGLQLHLLTQPISGETWGEKSGNYEAHIRALESARSAGADEAIVSDAKGRVLSCAMGNLLVWMPLKSGTLLCTPPSSQGASAGSREGARAGAVLEWVRCHTKVEERELKPRDLLRAVGMAVTNSRLGIMPAAGIDGRKLADPSPALQLSQEYLRSHGLLRQP